MFRLASITAFLATVSAFAPGAVTRGSYKTSLNMADFSLDPEDTAFVFIEYQNEFTTEGGKLHDAVKDVMAKTNSKYTQYKNIIEFLEGKT